MITIITIIFRRRFDFLIPSRMDRGLELFMAIHKDLMQVGIIIIAGSHVLTITLEWYMGATTYTSHTKRVCCWITS